MLPLFPPLFPLFPSLSFPLPGRSESEVRIGGTKRHGESCGQPALKRLGRKKSTRGDGFALVIGQLKGKRWTKICFLNFANVCVGDVGGCIGGCMVYGCMCVGRSHMVADGTTRLR